MGTTLSRSMTETRVPRGGKVRLGTLDGDLRGRTRLGHRCRRPVGGLGQARFDGNADVRGDMECGSFLSEDGTVRVRGHLFVREDLETRDGTVEVDGEFRARRVDADRGLTVGGPASAEQFEVGGKLEGAQTLTAKSVSVGGKFRLAGKLTASSVEAGAWWSCATSNSIPSRSEGSFASPAGIVRRKVEVGGTFSSEAPFEFGGLEVGGIARFRDAAKGGRIEAGD